MNCKFPEDFRKLYMNSNGEGEQIFGVMAGLGWMNIESIVSNWKSFWNQHTILYPANQI